MYLYLIYLVFLLIDYCKKKYLYNICKLSDEYRHHDSGWWAG